MTLETEIPLFKRVELGQETIQHCGKLGQYSTGAVGRVASSGLEGFGNFGRLHHRIKEGGHLPYEG